MSRRLHTHSDIFFPCSYMVRVKYSKAEWNLSCVEHRTLVKKAYKIIRGTWGHSMLVTQSLREPLETDSLSVSTTNVLSSYEINNHYGYFCFRNESDALHFRLSIDHLAIRVYMWPEKKFTIHEYD